MMALFGGSSDKQQALIDNAAQQALQNLASQDGLTHVLLLVSNGKISRPQTLAVDEKYSSELDQVLSYIQNQGREIVDIKFEIMKLDEKACRAADWCKSHYGIEL